MKEIKKVSFDVEVYDTGGQLVCRDEDGNDRIFDIDSDTEFYFASDVEQLQARIKELESQAHINEIKAQGIDEARKEIVNTSSISYIASGQYDGWYAAMRHFEFYTKNLRTKHG